MALFLFRHPFNAPTDHQITRPDDRERRADRQGATTLPFIFGEKFRLTVARLVKSKKAARQEKYMRQPLSGSTCNTADAQRHGAYDNQPIQWRAYPAPQRRQPRNFGRVARCGTLRSGGRGLQATTGCLCAGHRTFSVFSLFSVLPDGEIDEWSLYAIGLITNNSCKAVRNSGHPATKEYR
jgi:hypothetical protein